LVCAECGRPIDGENRLADPPAHISCAAAAGLLAHLLAALTLILGEQLAGEGRLWGAG